MKIKIINDNYCKSWNDYLISKKKYSPYAFYEWSKIIENTYDISCIMIAAFNSKSEICGIMPLYKIKDYFNKLTLYSFKYSFIYEDDSVCKGLLEFVDNYSKTNNINGLVISPHNIKNKLNEFDFIRTKTVKMEIENSEEKMWSVIRSKTRNMIKKARKENITIRHGDKNIKEFYEIYKCRMLKKGVRVHSFNFFDNIKSTLNNNMEVFIAEKDNNIIGTMFLVFFGENGAYAYGGSKISKGASPNQLLLWEMLKYCMSNGIKNLDLGESDEGSGVYKFKIWFGGKPEEVIYFSKKYNLISPFSSLNLFVGNFKRIISYFLIKYGTDYLKEVAGLWKRTKGPLF